MDNLTEPKMPDTLEQLINEYFIFRNFYNSLSDYKKGVAEKFGNRLPAGNYLHDYLKLKIGETQLRLNESVRGDYGSTAINTKMYIDRLAVKVGNT